MIGMNHTLYQAFNPIIQVFKPVSPLAWLPWSRWWSRRSTSVTTLVLEVVPELGDHRHAVLPVADHHQYRSRRFGCQQGPDQRQPRAEAELVHQDCKIILPSAIPMMFTGLRLSLGIGWMVLIAAEMLAQNPGLGKFVWDEFQNGSSNSLARIMVAVDRDRLHRFSARPRHVGDAARSVDWDKNAQRPCAEHT